MLSVDANFQDPKQRSSDATAAEQAAETGNADVEVVLSRETFIIKVVDPEMVNAGASATDNTDRRLEDAFYATSRGRPVGS